MAADFAVRQSFIGESLPSGKGSGQTIFKLVTRNPRYGHFLL